MIPTQKVNKAGFFSILADETQDRVKKELLQITVRYVAQILTERVGNKGRPSFCLVDLLHSFSKSVQIDDIFAHIN